MKFLKIKRKNDEKDHIKKGKFKMLILMKKLISKIQTKDTIERTSLICRNYSSLYILFLSSEE